MVSALFLFTVICSIKPSYKGDFHKQFLFNTEFHFSLHIPYEPTILLKGKAHLLFIQLI